MRDEVHAAGCPFDLLGELTALTTNTAASWSDHPFRAE
ncbi:MAG: hypothetical protein QOJ56_3153 [Mycobacterium sp.]|jgi:hypothetical protein|nr:hypothetical protein [Mycobacterium sp.]